MKGNERWGKAGLMGIILVITLSASLWAAPTGSVEKNHVILTNLPEKDPYHQAVVDYQAIHPDAKILRFSGREVDALKGKLRSARPKFVTLVVKPEDIDYNFHGRVLALCTGLDDDPLCDFSFGYITGATAGDAVRFVKAIAKAWKKGLPEKILNAPVSYQASAREEKRALEEFGVDWPLTVLSYGTGTREPLSDEAIRKRFQKHVKDYSGKGVVIMGGHGSPEGMHGGISGADVWAVKPDFTNAVVYNFACFTGCVSRAFQWVHSSAEYRQPVKARAVAKEKCIALAILASGASAYIASLEPRPQGSDMHMEMRHALVSGKTLGEVRRREYDKLTLGFLTWGEKGLVTRRYKDGDPRMLGSSPVRNMMMRDASGAILYGDPSFQLGAKGQAIYESKLERRDVGYALTCTVSLPSPRGVWDTTRQWGKGRRMATRFYAEMDLPAGTPEVEKIVVESVVNGSGSSVEHADLIWVIARRGENRRLHIKVNCPPFSICDDGSRVVFRINPEGDIEKREQGGPGEARPPGLGKEPKPPCRGEGKSPPRRGGGRQAPCQEGGEAGQDTPLAKALAQPWVLPRREWQLGDFLAYLDRVMKALGGGADWAKIQFAFGPGATEARGKTVTVESNRDSLRTIMDRICSQLEISYALEPKTITLRFVPKNEAGTSSNPQPPQAPAGGKGTPPKRRSYPSPAEGQVRWFPEPQPENDAAAKSLARLVQEFNSTGEDVRALMARSSILSRIGMLRTVAALKALHRLYQENDGITIRTQILSSMRFIDGAETAKLFFNLLSRTRERPLRKELQRNIQRLRARSAAETLIEVGLHHGDSTVREVSARALGGMKWKGAVAPLIEATRDNRLEPKVAAIESLGRLGFEEAVEALLELATKGTGQSAVVALWALGECGAQDPRIVETAKGMLKNGKPVTLKVQAVNLLGARGAVEALADLIPLLNHREWRLRAATIEALAKIRHKDAIEPLIGRLDREKGRLTIDVAKALYRITGIDIGFNTKLWREWWSKNKETFTPPPILQKEKKSGPDRTVATYHTIPVVSKRVIFILDISASMAMPLPRSAQISGQGEGAPKNGSKLECCKWELKRTINKLKRDVRFNIIPFESGLHAWQRGLVPAVPPNKHLASEFTDKQKPMGQTGLSEALKLAFQDKNADTFFVLSDGMPTDATASEILQTVSRLNATRMVVIHTISAGEPNTSAFLKELADQTGGKHVKLK
ncbi:MAG: HEAT repeat domain-containing protein [Planctomycetota bacterium]